ncbi:MAG: RagB/SusD family nutrient uptake outer membrane protein [Sphingobacteriales bacterium]|nr:MAG: RagB/SusD family nutrient uptake outer membrane protein [Sphingobacteriales bacterium]
MIKQNINRLLFGCAMIAGLAACSKKLDLVPETSLTDAGFWKSSNDLVLACNELYQSLPTITNNVNAIWTDDGYGSAPNAISDGTRTVPGTDNAFNIPYALIRKANTILEKSTQITDNAVTVRRYRAEAYFFRAFAYSELVKRYGDVPLLLRTFDVFDTLATPHRTPREIVLDTMYRDLDSAVAALPLASALAAAEYGRITRNAALALKSRMGLMEGTRNKYHNLGNAAKHLQHSLVATETLMGLNWHGLFKYSAAPDSSYFYLFQYAGNGPANRENILARLYGVNSTNSISEHNYTRQYLDVGVVTATRAMMDAYLYRDGLPLGQSPLQLPQDSTMAEFTNRDPRIAMTVFNKRVWGFNAAWVPTFNTAPTGYKIRKYATSQDWASQQSFNHHIIFRYAEILLNYAELKFEMNGAITDDELDKSINLIRARVNMPKLTNAFVATNNLNMLTEIRRERRVELAFEGEFRYWDLIRWKTAEIELPKTVKGSKKFPAEHVPAPPSSAVDANGFVIVQDASRRSFNVNRDYWWPFPTNETGLNPNLTQNPNW